LRPREALQNSLPERISHPSEYDRNGSRFAAKCLNRGRGISHDHVRLQGDQFLRSGREAVGVDGRPAIINPDIVAIDPTKLRKPGADYLGEFLSYGVALRICNQHTDATPTLLRPRRQRPRRRRGAEEGEELAAIHPSHFDLQPAADPKSPPIIT